MLRQHALHIDLADGRHDVVDLESPHFVGPVDYAWNNRGTDDPTVIGVGPLAGSPLPGASALVIAGHSPLWDGFQAATIEGAGRLVSGLGCSLVAIRGRAPQPSVLWVHRLKGDLAVRVEPVGEESPWRKDGAPPPTDVVLDWLVSRARGELQTFAVLATGPAAARTRFGGLVVAQVEDGIPRGPRGLLPRGAFGSRLYQTHRVCAVVLGSDAPAAALAMEDTTDGALDRFKPAMTLPELEAAVRFRFNPRLSTGGTLGATFNLLRHRVLWFNSSSVHLPEEQRDDLYRKSLREHYLPSFNADIARAGQDQDCGEHCPLSCRKVLQGRWKDFEAYAALGPLIGIADHAAADRVVERSVALGFDTLPAAGLVAWLMERVHLGLLAPSAVGLSAAPHWSARDFDPVADSEHNAQLAVTLLDGLLTSEWAEPLRRGLRSAARSSDEESAALAVYNANGESGEMVPLPYWAPGFYTPVPIAGQFHEYYGLEFVPPRVLGRKSAQRMVAELLLQNFGVCRLHRGWAEDLFPELVNQRHGTSVDWAAHHRDLARRIFQRRKARFWETQRVVDIIASFLQNYQYDAAPDAELDRWVRRFHEDTASAARAYWSEINAGLEEILGA
jgi:glyceraldehyde-3-phosphate dehydrogenase (ferredoxin)